jgi:hypothetical protein
MKVEALFDPVRREIAAKIVESYRAELRVVSCHNYVCISLQAAPSSRAMPGCLVISKR